MAKRKTHPDSINPEHTSSCRRFLLREFEPQGAPRMVVVVVVVVEEEEEEQEEESGRGAV